MCPMNNGGPAKLRFEAGGGGGGGRRLPQAWMEMATSSKFGMPPLP